MPTYRPLLSRAIHATCSLRHRYSGKMGNTKTFATGDSSYNAQADSRSRRPNYAELNDSESDVMKLTHVGGSKHDSQLPTNAIELM